MKWAISILMICCLTWIGVVSGAETATNETVLNETVLNETTYIFIQEGTGGSFVKDDSGNYTLTITGVMPYTVGFSDRPARDAGFAPMDKFIDGFCFNSSNPPNAAVTLREGEEESDMIVVELTMPQYDEINNTLTYKAKVIADYAFASGWMQDLIPRADDAIPEVFGRVVLVIDSCKDGVIYCDDGKYISTTCGSINTGCCWVWGDMTCEACHSSETYEAECYAKFNKGKTCSYNGGNEC